MVIWPKTVSREDHGWQQTCALLKTLPLDPRRSNGFRKDQARFYETASDFLIRPKIWVDRRLVEAPYFEYSLRFSVSVSSHGRIAIESEAELAEFNLMVGEALAGPLTQAERQRWEAMDAACPLSDRAYLRAYQQDDEAAAAIRLQRDKLYEAAREAGDKAHAFYSAEQRRCDTNGVPRHEEILFRLIEKGLAILGWPPVAMDA